MVTPMTAEHLHATYRCPDRTRLREYVNDTLGDADSKTVAAHIDACDKCHEAYLHMLMNEAPAAESVLNAPRIPPMDLYDAYLREQSSESGATLWVSIRNGREAVDQRVKDWARARLEEIREAFVILAAQMRAETTRGVVTLSHAPQTPIGPAPVEATLLTSDGQPAGRTVRLRLMDGPAILDTGHFHVHVSAPREYERHLVECALQLGDVQVSFAGELKKNGSHVEANIDEADVMRAPAPAMTPLPATFTVRPLPG
jgi:hypothetical protein